MIHNSKAFGGKPMRHRELAVDFNGHVAELMAKAANAGALDTAVSKEDKEKLLIAMREWGVRMKLHPVREAQFFAMHELRPLHSSRRHCCPEARVPRPRLSTAAMAGAELFVMPSRLEPFGIVVLEAWRAATAVLATDHGGPPEFVRDGEDGLLVDPFDTVAMAAALGRVLADGALRRSLAAAGNARGRKR